MAHLPRSFRLPQRKWATVAIAVALVAIVWISYRAAAEWKRSATALAKERAETAVDLLVTALSRDMRGAQMSVLSYPWPDELFPLSFSDPADVIAAAFARYPYPEVFFTWGPIASSDAVVFHSRSDRHPDWMPRDDNALFPVAIRTEPTAGQRLLDRVALDAALGRRYSVFEMALGMSRYQVVAVLHYRDSFREQIKAVFGFMVDLTWVRQHYLQELAMQVARINKADGIEFDILDGRGTSMVRASSREAHIAAQRDVPVLFFDPRIVTVEWPTDLPHEIWTTKAIVTADPALHAANRGATWTLLAAVASVVMLAIGLLLIVQAAHARTRVAEMRSEFVSTVTHELKTPIATIQTIGETFASDRGLTSELSRKYGRLTVHEAKRLRRLIDNLLAYARMTDATEMYSFECVSPHSIAEETLRDFSSQLEYANVDIVVAVPTALPTIRADRQAMKLALGNIVDNAIRYSPQPRYLRIAAHRDDAVVVLEVTDRGVGIPEKELPHVTRRFFRGRYTDVSGSGLGLAIVERIVKDHGGVLELRSAIDVGTTVSMRLPVSEMGREKAVTGR